MKITKTKGKNTPKVRPDDPAGPLMKKKNITCPCWNCLRSVGITPTRFFAPYHKDIFGNEYRTDNGQILKPKEAKNYDTQESGRGLRKEAT